MSAQKFSTYDQEGKAEDYSDIITDISPTDTPFLSSIKNEKVHNTFFSWQEDSLAVAANNAQIEGADAGAANQSATQERTNRTQILTKTVQVTGTADAIKTYGRAKETAYQLGKALKEIKRDYERAMVGVSNTAQAGDDSTAREMDSVDQTITTTVDAGSNNTDPLTEDKLLTLGQNCYENGSEPNMLMIKPADSLLVAGFARTTDHSRVLNDDERKLVHVIDLLVTPFGEYRTVINRHQLGSLAFLIDPAMFSSITLRPFTRTLLAKDGDADKHFIVGEVSVKHRNFADSGMITGLS